MIKREKFLFRKTMIYQVNDLLKLTFFIYLFLSFNAFIYSQVWVARYNGEANLDDCATALAVDEQQNVYVTGYSYGLSNIKGYLTIKYNPYGETLWTRRYEGFGDSEAKSLVLDRDDNIYVTGWSDGENTQSDILTIKYNAWGDTLWTRRFNSPANHDDEPTKIKIDSKNNIYITGFSFNEVSNYDYTTIKYNRDGLERWVSTYNGTGDSTDKANSVAVDREENVYVTGVSYGLGTKGDFATIKYDTLGNLIWVTRYDDTTNIFDDEAIGIGLDSFCNVYVAGISDFDSLPGTGLLTFTIIKYNSSGEKRWIAKSFPGAGADLISDMTVDHNGNVYVTGTYIWWNTHRNFKTEMYDSSGQRLWVAGYDADSVHDFSCAAAVDNSGNVYITGKSETRRTGYDFVLIKYNQNGTELWVARYNGPANNRDEVYAIAVDEIGNVYVTGRSEGLVSLYDYCTIKYPPSGPGIVEHKKLKRDYNDTKISNIIKQSLNPQFEFYNVQGRRITLSNLSTGVYFILKKDKNVKEKLVIVK